MKCYFLMMIPGNMEPTAVGKVEISKPVLKIASCCLCNDAINEQKRYVKPRTNPCNCGSNFMCSGVITNFYHDPLCLQVNVTKQNLINLLKQSSGCV